MKRTLVGLAAGLCCAGALQAAPVQWTSGPGANGHWYEFIATNVSWQDAFVAANAATFMGLQGYLSTVTSDLENSFVLSTVAGGALSWLGGSDDGGGNEGIWSWRNGPEAGQVFWNTGTTLIYANWEPGEPNNCCTGENFLHGNFAQALGWNDHGGPGNGGQINGYVIEYSAAAPLPTPAPLALLAAAGLGLALTRRRR